VNGILAKDTVSVSGLTLQKFQFTEVTSYDHPNIIGANDQDGIAGMSFIPDAKHVGFNPSIPLMSALIQNRVVTVGQFSYYIAPGDKTGSAIFGGYHAKYFENPNDPLIW
jgi:hypothetical protein